MKKKLTKSNTDIMLTGLLAGIGEYLNIDATIVRVIFVILSFLSFGTFFLLYFIFVAIVPRRISHERTHHYEYYGEPKKERKRKNAEKIDDDEWSDF